MREIGKRAIEFRNGKKKSTKKKKNSLLVLFPLLLTFLSLSLSLFPTHTHLKQKQMQGFYVILDWHPVDEPEPAAQQDSFLVSHDRALANDWKALAAALASLPAWKDGRLKGRVLLEPINEPDRLGMAWNVASKGRLNVKRGKREEVKSSSSKRPPSPQRRPPPLLLAGSFSSKSSSSSSSSRPQPTPSPCPNRTRSSLSTPGTAPSRLPRSRWPPPKFRPRVALRGRGRKQRETRPSSASRAPTSPGGPSTSPSVPWPRSSSTPPRQSTLFWATPPF